MLTRYHPSGIGDAAIWTGLMGAYSAMESQYLVLPGFSGEILCYEWKIGG